ncbi:membrane-bound protein lytR [Paenibacillus terrae HPL-003]|uniref:Membrane-bound protein lytR n=1 Tax=Paenibacillus terrae (strain HPL-003) TaxID=985665 RepID=G7W0D2_PAETH|nr:LCP family protein [Paenibacillus terrae]AET59553.1 membrane-bound protein lytR [Paenibacillus terrae HPL-003]
MKRWLKMTLAAAALLMVGAGAYTAYVYHSVQTAANAMYHPRSIVQPAAISTLATGGAGRPAVTSNGSGTPNPAAISQFKPFTVLVLGVDQRPHDRGRSDTMIVLSVNPAEGTVLMFNIPRDTRTELIGRGREDKINHAFAFGGVDMSIRTVEHFLNHPMDYYVQMNMEGFAKMVDLLGGVAVNNPHDFQYEGHHFTQGSLKLNGTEALAYARMRFDDPRGDLGRNARQRELLKQIAAQVISKEGLLKVKPILQAAGEQIRTDITFDDMTTFLTRIGPSLRQTDMVELKGHGTKINGVYYYIVDDQERQRIRGLMEKHLLTTSISP